MTADKRSVHTDALATLGTIIGDGEKRDAIHLAVEPVIAAVALSPGDHVSLRGGMAYASAWGSGVGIVDPFLGREVQPGERFWLVVYPRRITSLRHVWEHPDFPPSGETETPTAAPDMAASEEWLRTFIAESDCPSYETVIAAAISHRSGWYKDYLHFNDMDAHGEIPPEFWDHVEVVTGVKVPPDQRADYFSCSC